MIEGIDQSGKETQAKLLARRLRRLGFRTETLSYPIYTSYSGREISAFLDGRRSGPPQVLHMLYAINRWESLPKLKALMKSSDYLIIDRYSPSNIAYGVAHGLDREWLINLDQGLPRPHKVVLIDTSVTSSFARKASGRDVHERDVSLLRKVRAEYLKLANKQHWKVVGGNQSQKKVGDNLWKLLGDIQPRRSQPRGRPRG